MEELVDKTLSSLNNATKIVDLKFTLKLFLQGLKDVTSENDMLRNELKEKCTKISSLETQIKELQHEKVDMVNTLEFNAASIKDLENQVKSTASQFKPQTIESIQDSIDDTNQYARRGALTLSGKGIPAFNKDENTKEIVIDQLRRFAKYNLSSNDISIAHRLGPKPSSGPDKRNIRFRLCRRDLADGIVSACKHMSAPFYINPSLTPLRSNLLYALRQLKKKNPAVLKSCRANLKGEIEAYTTRPGVPTEHAEGTAKNLRKTVMTSKKELDNFCNNILKLSLSSVKVNWNQTGASNL